MLFTSPTFLFFFLPACLATYFLAPSLRLKNAVLISASLIFYAWGEPSFALLMGAMIVFNYAAARIVDGRDGGARKLALGAAVTVNLGLLVTFKYLGFIVHALNHGLALVGRPLAQPNIPLPLGISFFTFHCLSYLTDVYRRRFPANRSLPEVALYIALFPQLIAGPIVRYKTIARRLRMRRHSLGRLGAGLRIFVLGLAQKVLLADPLARLSAAAFDTPHAPGAAEAWLGAVAYTLQLYFDFAGYSSMAIGLAIVFGFSLPRNFRTPYASRSITEFWRRWHISLSSWFRDYVYIPLGGNRGGPMLTYRNLIIVFFLCGLWHGAGWTFILWGLWHGAFLILERAGLGRVLERAPAPVAWAYTLIVVVFGWVLFRAPNVIQALAVWRGMLGLNPQVDFSSSMALAFEPKLLGVMAVGGLLAIFGLKPPRWRPPPAPALAWAQNLAVVGLLWLSILRVAAGTFSPFLYFRF